MSIYAVKTRPVGLDEKPVATTVVADTVSADGQWLLFKNGDEVAYAVASDTVLSYKIERDAATGAAPVS